MTARYLVLEDSPRGFDAYRGASHGIPWPERLSSRDAETLRVDRATSFAGDLDGVISYVSLCCKSTPWLRVLALYGGLLDVPPPAIPLVPSVFIGYDVWTTTQYSLIEQAVLGGVPDGTHAVALQPALNGFGLFDTQEDAQRLRLLWKASTCSVWTTCMCPRCIGCCRSRGAMSSSFSPSCSVRCGPSHSVEPGETLGV